VGTFSAGSGLHLFTEVSAITEPLELQDESGPVDFYGIPFIEPSLHRKVEWMPDDASSQHTAIAAAMTQIRGSVESRKSKGRRSVVVSHTFVAGAESASSDSERPITRTLEAGGVDNVPKTYSPASTTWRWDTSTVAKSSNTICVIQVQSSITRSRRLELLEEVGSLT